MTNEKAIGKLVYARQNADEELDPDWCASLDMAIKALEQEPFMNKPCVAYQVCHEDKIKVLDKIRAEIEKPLHDERCFDTADAKAQYIALNWCIEIIDKYRKEQE